MTISKLQDMITLTIKSKAQWAVWISFDPQLYSDMYNAGDLLDDSKYPQSAWKYLSAALPDKSMAMAIWPEHALFHFPTEEEARGLFERIPEGSLVSAELYSPDGTFQDENT